RSNRETGGVGAGALIAASRRRVDAIEIPDREHDRADGLAVVVGRPRLVKLLVIAVDDDEVAVLLARGALVARLSFHAATGRKRHGTDLVRGIFIELFRRAEGNVRR